MICMYVYCKIEIIWYQETTPSVKIKHICELCQIQRKSLKEKQFVSNKIPIKKFNDGKSDKSTELLNRLPRHILYQR